MIRLSLLVVSLLLTSTSLAADVPQWEQIDEEDGIKVFKKDMPGSDIVAFKGSGIVDASMEKIFWVISDAEHEHEWVDMLVDNLLLEEESPFDRVQYQNFDLPWPLSDRDFVYRAIAEMDKEGRFYLEMNSVEHPKAPESKGVRAEIMESTIILKAREDGRTDVEVSIFSDPKGILPTWLVNMIQESWPMETMAGIRKQVKKSFVKEARLPPTKVVATAP